MKQRTLSCLASFALLHDAVSGISLPDRRKFVNGAISSIVVFQNAKGTLAACLPGDLDPSCIGVYKVPLDACINDMVSTKEALRRFAPDLNFVPPMAPPTSTKAALEALQTQRLAVDDIATVVAAGRLEEAGIKVLNLIPRLTLSGRVLVEAACVATEKKRQESDDVRLLRRQQMTALLQTAEVAWNEVDILIGQGISGRLGVSAVAQLLILSEVRDATTAMDNFLDVVTLTERKE